VRRMRPHKGLIAALAVAALAVGCAEDPKMQLVRTGPADEVLRLVYDYLLKFNPTGAYDLAREALKRTDFSDADRLRIEYASAIALENYKPKKDKNIEKAREIFLDIAARSPELAPKALLHVARAYEVHLNEPEPDKAKKTYEKIIADFPDTPSAYEATLRLGVNLLWRSDGRSRKEGGKILEAFIAAHPRHPIAVPMHLALADAAITREQFKRAVDHLVAAYEKGIIPFRRRMRAVYQIGNIAYLKLKDFKLAEKYYAIGVEQYRNWVGSYEAAERLEKIRRGKRPKAAKPAETGKSEE